MEAIGNRNMVIFTGEAQVTTQIKIAILLASTLLIFGYTKAIQHLAYQDGAASVQSRWDTETARRDLITEQLKSKNEKLSQENKDLTAGIATNLENANVAHAKVIAGVRAEYTDRLRKSEARSGIYREQAEGGATQCRRLASHATELDRSLEEGRSVVQELRTTVGLRDQQLEQLGRQILADRALLN
jgi:cell division protein FtsB